MSARLRRLWAGSLRPAWLLGPWRLNIPTSADEALRIERVIAVARLLLTVIALFALDFNPIQPIAHGPGVYLLLILFTAHSLSALLVLRTRQRTTAAFSLTTHAVDLLAAVITLPMAGATNSFFTFFLFVLAAAAFRWGLWETVTTAAAAMGMVTLHARLASMFPVLNLGEAYDFQLVLVRASYLAVMGLLLAFLVEEGHLLRSEMAVVVRLLRKIRVDAGLPRAVQEVAQETRRLLQAANVMLVIENVESRRLFRWDLEGGWTIGPLAGTGEPAAADRDTFLFGQADQTIAVTRDRWLGGRAAAMSIRVLDPAGRVAHRAGWTVPDGFVAAHPFKRLIATPVRFGDEWAGRAYIFDPGVQMRLVALAHLLQVIVRQVGPALFSVYLLSELRARAGAIERARVARELHDGVIQSLIGVEMQLQVLRGRAGVQATPVEAELMNLQTTLRNEVVSLRELLQQMRPQEFDPEELLDHLADTVQRFGRDTGISARFVTDVKQVDLPRHVCFELMRIVQEGLANVRKHSAAKTVLVRFGVQRDGWRLEIDDDGRGFPFEGRLQHADLDARRSGPVIIKERVRAIGGQLAIHSEPGRGARLEVLVPQTIRG